MHQRRELTAERPRLRPLARACERGSESAIRCHTMPTHYDAIVIGTGQAGPSLAARLAKAGRKTAVLERRRFGGTCVNVGCIPTKTLVASARAIQVARRGAEFGFTPGLKVGEWPRWWSRVTS